MRGFSIPELGVGKYGSALKGALELRGSSALDLTTSIQPVVVLDDLTIGPSSTRRWLAGQATVAAGVGVVGVCYISCPLPGRQCVVMPYIAIGAAQAYNLRVFPGGTLSGVQSFAQDMDVRKGTGTTASGVLALNVDTGAAPAPTAAEVITTAGQSGDFRGLYVVGTNDFIGVSAATNNTTYTVGVIGWLVET